MPKIKTRKTAAKRFKITGTGKFIHEHAHHNHLNIHKSPSNMRKITGTAVLYKGKLKSVRRMLPNGIPD